MPSAKSWCPIAHWLRGWYAAPLVHGHGAALARAMVAVNYQYDLAPGRPVWFGARAARQGSQPASYAARIASTRLRALSLVTMAVR
jgi:hypothetical protein